MLLTLVWYLIKAVIVTMVLILGAAVELLFERKVLGYFQYRVGPNRVGPWGAFQPIADVVKMLFKEDLIPRDADKIVFRIAPMIAFFTTLAVFVVIPWGPNDGWKMAHPAAGILVYLALGSLSIYGVALGGWASQSKYSLLGSMRATAQMISYEVPLSMALIGVIVMAGSVDITKIVTAQGGSGYHYFWLPQLLGFFVFFISALAETSRTPFDLPEAETELVGGYNTEYAGMRFGLFFLGEIVAMLNMSTLITLLYLGGWNTISWLSFIPGPLAFFMKICFMIFVFMWIRVTWPRMRYDKLMNFGWKVLLPIAAVNLLGTAIYVALWA
jgi:NADH-quinone oxidoreductase subunit H